MIKFINMCNANNDFIECFKNSKEEFNNKDRKLFNKMLFKLKHFILTYKINKIKKLNNKIENKIYLLIEIIYFNREKLNNFKYRMEESYDCYVYSKNNIIRENSEYLLILPKNSFKLI